MARIQSATSMKLLLMFVLAAVAAAQTKPAAKQPPKPAPKAAATAAPASAQPAPPEALYSGMYSFTREGEFVQLDFQPEGKLGGFVSRFGTLESDRDAFLDQFIKTGSYKGHDLSFTTAPVHSMWYEFKGRVDRGPGKSPAEEGYYVVKGTLTEYTEDANKKTSARSRDITMKSFPQEEPPQ